MGIRIDDPGGLLEPGGLERAVARQLRAGLDARCASVVCATHGQSARIDWGDLPLDVFPEKFNIVACCDETAKRAQAALPDDPRDTSND